MGTSVSRQTDLSSNEFLVRFIAKGTISKDDNFWDRFLSFSITPPWKKQLSLDSRVETLCQKLLLYDTHTANFSTLIQVFHAKASKILSLTNTDSIVLIWQTFNALFVIRCIIKYLTETVSEYQMLQHFEASDKLKTQKQVDNHVDNNVNANVIVDKQTQDTSTQINGVSKENNKGFSKRIESFVEDLINIIAIVPTRDITYALHLEAVNCALILLTNNVFSNQKTEDSVIYKTVMQGVCCVKAAPLTRALLQHISHCTKAPPSMFGNASGGSFVLDLWSLLTFSKSRSQTTQALNSDSPEALAENFRETTPLANHSLLLLLVLTNHCTTQKNVYRDCLFSCVDTNDPSNNDSISFRVDFLPLFNTLCNIVCLDQATLLLYLLLHKNQNFKKFVLTNQNLDLLVVPILRTLYNAPNSTSHHIYMSLIILLMLSEDDGFNKSVHQMQLKSIPWYTERSMTEISLGGLLILVIIRTIQYNMIKMRDKYLHTNCLAALANMSGQFRDLHPYVAQRLVSLFETLAKKHSRLQLMLQKKTQNVPVETVINTTDSNDLEQDLIVLEEVLRMVLEILNSCLSQQLPACPNLVYALLYNKHIFEPFRTNAAFQDIIQNIDMVIGFFSSRLQRVQEQSELGVHEVLVTINKGSTQWSKDRLRKFPELKFKYVEEESPEEFFIPYIWGLVLNGSALYFNSESLTSVATV
ncbi:LOW QUALITY PROTEIN: dymeclin-like [Ctenocephalides felis]|uniref:LOW QUALITY PROTEIN: dymeclin-like n=1 Tax=Ctenocephalides felis TaxID=7515 RepID=UPI000E6E205B|nr:LOW QUALITY PROTEIN: dymeclin-like [Ctenocephalides felis]